MRSALAVLSWLAVVTAFTGPAATFCTRPAACRLASPRLAADHPAVAGWPAKYDESRAREELSNGLYSGTKGGPAPRVLHDAFAVLSRPQLNLVVELDVQNWPTWTTAGNDRWLENDTRKDKEMPYGSFANSSRSSPNSYPSPSPSPSPNSTPNPNPSPNPDPNPNQVSCATSSRASLRSCPRTRGCRCSSTLEISSPFPRVSSPTGP